MNYSQFQSEPLRRRFSGARGWLAFAIGTGMICLSLLVLPILLLIGAVSLLLLSLFGRVFLQRQLARFQSGGFAQATSHGRRGSAQDFDRDDVNPARRQGHTYEHDPNA